MADSTIAMPNYDNTVMGSSPMVVRTSHSAVVPSSVISVTTPLISGIGAHGPSETIEWAKFCMWLRGYLSAIEGKELTSEDSAKIMEKLATVDPDSQARRIYDPAPNPYISPYSPLPSAGGEPPWTYTTGTNTTGTNTTSDTWSNVGAKNAP
jgi:hypothetical protein